MKTKKTVKHHEKERKLERVISKNGYLWVLVEAPERKQFGLPQPCFDGNYGYALKTCRKITI